MIPFLEAFETFDIENFIRLTFPASWGGVGARILESGVEFAEGNCDWSPRWSKIPRTVRKGRNELETAVKSCIYRVHDCIHQLWGLPIPGCDFTEDDRYLFKRAGMCGEVAVLAVIEFAFCDYIYQHYPEVRELIWSRNAVPLIKEGGPLQYKNLTQIAIRLDGLLHKKLRPKWVRENAIATAFADDYVPMLEKDRYYLDRHWEAMKAANWLPDEAPNSRYSPDLDGLELTIWMIEDFLHLIDTDTKIDKALREFNRIRRASIVMPSNWDGKLTQALKAEK
jgi:hypothetical protein